MEGLQRNDSQLRLRGRVCPRVHAGTALGQVEEQEKG